MKILLSPMTEVDGNHPPEKFTDNQKSDVTKVCTSGDA